MKINVSYISAPRDSLQQVFLIEFLLGTGQHGHIAALVQVLFVFGRGER